MTVQEINNVASRATALRKFDKEQRKRELRFRQSIAARHRPTTWPLDAMTLQPAEWLEPGDVCMPAPPGPPPMSATLPTAVGSPSRPRRPSPARAGRAGSDPCDRASAMAANMPSNAVVKLVCQ